jgi:hypothetical protein
MSVTVPRGGATPRREEGLSTTGPRGATLFTPGKDEMRGMTVQKGGATPAKDEGMGVTVLRGGTSRGEDVMSSTGGGGTPRKRREEEEEEGVKGNAGLSRAVKWELGGEGRGARGGPRGEQTQTQTQTPRKPPGADVFVPPVKGPRADVRLK